MKYRWSIAPSQPVLNSVLARDLGLSTLLTQCLLNRGFSDPEPIRRFLDPRLKDLADPFLLPQMRVAVDRLFTARARQELVVIFGDYDVDGVTSCTLLCEVLRALGWRVECHLPQRLEEGYGLSQVGVTRCLNSHPATLLLAVDCGSTSVEPIAWLLQQGVDTIVLDHHQVSNPAPAACALVNPQLASGEVPSFRELCSVGLAFKLAHALIKEGRAQGLASALALDVRSYLDLVALGTIADLVPLRGENRILVRSGLQRLAATNRPGLVALKKVAAVNSRVGGYEVGFQLAPRLNAAGRLETAEHALHLLMAATVDEAEPLAMRLDAQNRERQQIERAIADEVIAALRIRFNPETDHVIVEGQMPWHVGVVGIVASRVLQEFHRPTIILGGDGEAWRGSGRSIDGFDLAAALRECDEFLLRHGGHAMAAGVTMRPENLDALRLRLNDLARRTLKPEQFQRVLRLDGESTLAELSLERLQELAQIEQTGIGNPPVQLVARQVSHARPLQRLGAERKHAKMWLTDGAAVREAVLWGVGDGPLPVGRFDVAFAPSVNHYQGNASVQLRVLDWAPAN